MNNICRKRQKCCFDRWIERAEIELVIWAEPNLVRKKTRERVEARIIVSHVSTAMRLDLLRRHTWWQTIVWPIIFSICAEEAASMMDTV